MHTTRSSSESTFTPLKICRWHKVLCMVLLLTFHGGLCSHAAINSIEKWKSKLVDRFQNWCETVTIYGVAQYGRQRLDSSAVQINVNNHFVVTTTTDRRGRFSFQLPPDMLIDTLRMSVDIRSEIIFAINESALLASKRIYRLKYRTYRFNGCPSF